MKITFWSVLFNDAVKYGNYMASVVYGSFVVWNKGKPKYNSHFLHHITHTDIEPGLDKQETNRPTHGTPVKTEINLT